MLSINKYSSQDILSYKNTNVVCLYIKINNNKLSYNRINNNYFERAESIVNMIKDTLNKYTINNLEIYINLMDIPINNPYFLQFSRTTNSMVNTIPNFSFYEWKDVKEINLGNFYNIKNRILHNNVNWDNKINKIMWSGSSSHEIRKKFNVLKSHEMYEYNLCDITKKYYDLKDHGKYKYLLDLEGVGYSGRFPYLALTGSCVILIENIDHDRDYKLYYDDKFIEDIHYLKVRYSEQDEISSINERILDKIKISDCKKIGEDCQKLANDLFTKDNILEYMANILNYYASHYCNTKEKLNHNLVYYRSNLDRLKKIRLFNFNK